MPLERDNSEEFLKREARAAQLAEEIEASATYKARVALENDERSEEEKYSAVVRDAHTVGRSDIRLHADNNYTSVGHYVQGLTLTLVLDSVWTSERILLARPDKLPENISYKKINE